MAAAYVERLAWDTESFGVPMGSATLSRLDEASAQSLLAEAERLGLVCLYFRAVADDAVTVSTAERHGFHLVDVRLVLERSPAAVAGTAPAEAAGCSIDIARADEMPRLQDIAAEIAPRSRYAFDPNFGLAESIRLYRQWIENACHGFADAVLVTRDARGGEATGFVACTLHDRVAAIQLIGVHSAARRRGVGASLFRGAIGWARDRDARCIRIVTQAHNLPAQRIAQRFAFLTRDVTLVYHRWLTAPRAAG